MIYAAQISYLFPHSFINIQNPHVFERLFTRPTNHHQQWVLLLSDGTNNAKGSMGIPCTWTGATGGLHFAPLLSKESFMYTHNHGDSYVHLLFKSKRWKIHATDACTKGLVIHVWLELKPTIRTVKLTSSHCVDPEVSTGQFKMHFWIMASLLNFEMNEHRVCLIDVWLFHHSYNFWIPSPTLYICVHLALFPGHRRNGLGTCVSSNCYFRCLEVSSTNQISEHCHMTTVKTHLHNALNCSSHTHLLQ